MEQVAGGIVRDLQVERPAGDGAAVRGEELGHVVHASGEPATVLFHERAAPRAVHDDRLVAFTERRHIRPCQGTRRVAEPGVRVQGAAANLPGNLAYLVAVDA